MGEISERTWPLGGYAPGNYLCTCLDCGATFEGDKRAYQCLPCAAFSVNDALRRAEARQAPGDDGIGQWFDLTGDARLGRCATDGCGGHPTMRHEAGGVGANYCSGCAARIRSRQAPLPAGTVTEERRDVLGLVVREAWIKWAKQQPNPKPSWLLPYDDLAEPDKEADRQIGEAVAAFAARPAEPVAVMGLRWEQPDGHGETHSWLGHGTDYCQYYIRWDSNGAWVIPGDADEPDAYATIDEAKAAAQADYEQRIRSALVSTTAPGLVEVRDALGETLDKDFAFWSSNNIPDSIRSKIWGVYKALASITETGGAKE